MDCSERIFLKAGCRSCHLTDSVIAANHSDIHRLSCFSGSWSPHLEHATTACHLCLIVDCI